MITKNDIIADMHTHSTASLHAYSTIKENMDQAKAQNLSYLAITDHFYGYGFDLDIKNETSRIQYLEQTINAYHNDIYVIGGTEFNIGQTIDDFILSKIVWKPVGLHNWFLDASLYSPSELFYLFKYAIKTYHYNCFNHIERELHKTSKNGEHLTDEMKSFYKDICELAKKEDVYLEVNETSIILNDHGAKERLLYWLSIARENENKICLGTDAHFCMNVGHFENTLEILNKFDYPKELILNCNEDMIQNLYKKI